MSYYDKKYNEVVFKIYDKSLVFNEQLQEFTCFYTIDPEWMLTFSNRFYSISNNQVYLHNTTDNLSEQTYPSYTLDDGSYADINLSKIQFIVNKDYEYTKTFDNVFFNGDLIIPESEQVTDFNVVKNVYFKTRTQENDPIDQSNMSTREDTYIFHLWSPENMEKKINVLTGTLFYLTTDPKTPLIKEVMFSINIQGCCLAKLYSPLDKNGFVIVRIIFIFYIREVFGVFPSISV